jgi:hypothetical protein
MSRLMSRLVSLHLYLISVLRRAVVDAGLLDILEEVAPINSYIFN